MKQLKLGEVIRLVVRFSGFALIAVTYLGLLDSLHWLLDLVVHFRAQYAVCLLILGAAAFRWCSRLTAVLLIFHCGLNIVLMAPYFQPLPVKSSQQLGAFKLLSFNVNMNNTNYQGIVDFVSRSQADAAMLIEIGTEWERRLSPLRKLYPHVISEARDDNFGIALFSRYPIFSGEIRYTGEIRRPTIYAEIEIGGRRVTLAGTHPIPPVGEEHSRLRNDHLNVLGAELKQARGPLILAGDLNITPWSSRYRDLLSRSGLLNAAQGRFVMWTWPANLFPLAIPIDHILVSPDFRVDHFKTGPSLGSDHFPLIVDLTLLR